MAELCSEIVVSQIAVCIEMNNLSIRILLKDRLEAAKSHEVFAADHERELAVV